MDLMKTKLTLLLIICIAKASRADLAKADCESQCGDMDIPYPFGTNESSTDCHIADQFMIHCDKSSNPPKAYWSTSTIQVLNISLDVHHLRILQRVAYDCHTSSGERDFFNTWIVTSTFPISNTKNKFTAVGCDTNALIQGSRGQKYATGCISFCTNQNDVIEGPCSGTGCCEATIPTEARSSNISLSSYYNHNYSWSFNPCSYAFVAENNTFNFSIASLEANPKELQYPMILDWAIGNETCNKAKSNPTTYACKDNSDCTDSDNGSGYQCSCSAGFEGNPYLDNGCVNINECETLRPCNQTCKDLVGTYNCSCAPGYEGNGFKNGTGCTLIPSSNKFPVMEVTVGIGVGLIVLIVGSSWLYIVYKHRKLVELKKKFFKQNGGYMLREQLNRRDVSIDMAKIFSKEELEEATDNYNESKIIGKGGYGTVYKGYLKDNRAVAIKKSKIVDQTQIEQFINEVIVLSQINHRNVVKLLGCCLETEVPLLVYEFVTNGTLFDHIHNQSKTSILSWETRFKIAAETAGALSYLHSAASTPIIHRDVKPTNILLDDNYRAKVSDFGASRLVPVDHAELSTMVQGTLGYLDPEYLHTSQLTEKSDVYSFGVVLVELLTGKKALSFDRPEADRSLVKYFLSLLKEDRLIEVLDDRVARDGVIDQLREVAEIAKRCLRVKGEERPTMKEVAIELEGLIVIEKHSWIKVEGTSEETQHLLGESSNVVLPEDSSNPNAGYDSLRNQILLTIDDGR